MTLPLLPPGKWSPVPAVFQYLIKGDEREPFNKKGGSMETSDLFRVSKTTSDVSLTEKDGVFSVTFAPYDFNGGKHKDSGLKFVCNVDNVPTP